MIKVSYFENSKTLIKYITEHNIQTEELGLLQTIEVERDLSEESPVPKVEDKDSISETIEVKLISFHDNPIIEAKWGEANILYVNELLINENSCMPAIIDILGKKVSVILCNEAGKTHANFSIDLNNKPMYDLPFEVRKLNGQSCIIEIDQNLRPIV